MEQAGPRSPPWVRDPRLPWPSVLPVTDRLFREGEAAGHPRWHRSTAGTLAGQEGSGAREDFANAVVLQDLDEI